MTSICNYCLWNDLTFDEIGVIDYCSIRDIYSDKMEFIEECYDFKDNRRVGRTQNRIDVIGVSLK